MKNSFKGALLSGLVFPGYGQYALKHYIRSTALMLTALTGLIVIGVKFSRQTFAILENIDPERGAIDMTVILSTVSQASTSSGCVIYRCASLFILLCWVIGIVDAYMVGRKRDLVLGQKWSKNVH